MTEKQKQGTEKKSEKLTGAKIAIIRIRGDIRVNRDTKAALTMLGLARKNTCVVKADASQTHGALKKVKDYVTWGNLSEETYKLLNEKRKDDKKENSFRLHPPRKGFGRKGIKASFVTGGALGDRKEKINDLITRMV